MTKLTKQSGFTLIEVMVSVSVIAILSAVAAPTLANLLDRNRTKTVANLFQDNLRLARYDSKTRSNDIIVFCAVRSRNKERCVGNNNKTRFSNGWQWFIENDTPPNYQYNPATDVLLGNTFDSDPQGASHDISIEVTTPDSIFRNRLIFNKGTASIINPRRNTITPIITFTNREGRTSSVSFDATGRSTLQHH